MILQTQSLVSSPSESKLLFILINCVQLEQPGYILSAVRSTAYSLCQVSNTKTVVVKMLSSRSIYSLEDLFFNWKYNIGLSWSCMLCILLLFKGSISLQRLYIGLCSKRLVVKKELSKEVNQCAYSLSKTWWRHCHGLWLHQPVALEMLSKLK